MFVRCSHPNVSTFSASMRRTVALFSANVSGKKAMFVRRRRDVLESLHVPLPLLLLHPSYHGSLGILLSVMELYLRPARLPDASPRPHQRELPKKIALHR